MKNDPFDPEVRIILEKREVTGLRISIIVLIVFLLYFLVSLLFGATGSIEIILTGVLLLSIGCALIALLLLLRNGKHLSFSGISLAVVVVIMIAALPFIWYYSLGWTSVPASFLLKTVVAQYSAGP